MPARPNFYYNNPYLKQIGDNLSAAIFGAPELEGIRLENQRKRQMIDAEYENQLEVGRRKGYEEEFWNRYAQSRPTMSPEAAAENADFRELTGVDNPYLAGDSGPESMLGAVLTNPELMGLAVRAGLIDPKDMMTTERAMLGDQLRYQGTLDRNDATRYGHDVRAGAQRDVAGIRAGATVDAANVRADAARYGADRRYDASVYGADRRVDAAQIGADARVESAKLRPTSTRAPLDVDGNDWAAIQEGVTALARRETDLNPEDTGLIVENRGEIERLAAEYYQGTRNLPAAVYQAWTEVMGYEPMVGEVGGILGFGADTRVAPGPGAGAAPPPAPKPAGTKPPAAAPGKPVVINSPQERDALPPGTPYIAAGDPTQTVRVRQ